MATQITGKNIDLTDALKAHVEKRVSEFEKYGFDLIQVDVELDTSTHHNKGEDVHHARMNVKVPHEFFHAEAEKSDMYAAIDSMLDKLDRQVRKHKEKLTDHHRREGGLKKQQGSGE